MMKKKKVALIVDDNRMNRMIHKVMLTNLGVECHEAENGREAIDICLRSGVSFDLILIDNEMPVMDGPQATRLLRRMGVPSMLIGVTGNSRNRDKQEFLESGIDDFYVKPLTQTKLVSILQKLEDC